MFSLARSLARPSVLARSFAAPAGASAIHTLPELPYPYNVRLFSSIVSISSRKFLVLCSPWLIYTTQALEPHISEQIMNLHHTKHHQTYVNGLNAAEESYAKSSDVKEKIKLQSALKFNGGGMRSLASLLPPHAFNFSLHIFPFRPYPSSSVVFVHLRPFFALLRCLMIVY